MDAVPRVSHRAVLACDPVSAGTNATVPTNCPVCSTPYGFGSTGARVAEAGPAGERDLVAEAVAYCPNPDCPSHAEGQVDDPGGA